MVILMLKKVLFIIFALFLFCGVVFAEGDGVKIPVLMYHHIATEYESKNALVTITPDEFNLHLWAIRNEGYEPISFGDYEEYAQNGKQLPAKPIIIAFDDGYLSNYEYAYPLLKAHNMKATIFIITSLVGTAEKWGIPHFDWQQAREMEASGLVDIESHTHSHRELDKLDEASLQRELRLSKYLIEKNMGKKVNVLAYPFGMYNNNVFSMAQRAGYTIQCKVSNAGSNKKESITAPLTRLNISGNMTDKALIKLIKKNLY